MYTTMMAARISHGWLRTDASKARAVPWRLPITEVGLPIRASRAWIASTASPNATPGARLKDKVTAGNSDWWFTVTGETPFSTAATRLKGTNPLAVEDLT